MEGLYSLQLLFLSENEYLEWKCSEHQAASLIFTDLVPLLTVYPRGKRDAIFNFQTQVFYLISNSGSAV